jgi:hypothetical protein
MRDLSFIAMPFIVRSHSGLADANSIAYCVSRH